MKRWLIPIFFLIPVLSGCDSSFSYPVQIILVNTWGATPKHIDAFMEYAGTPVKYFSDDGRTWHSTNKVIEAGNIFLANHTAGVWDLWCVRKIWSFPAGADYWSLFAVDDYCSYFKLPSNRENRPAGTLYVILGTEGVNLFTLRD